MADVMPKRMRSLVTVGIGEMCFFLLTAGQILASSAPRTSPMFFNCAPSLSALPHNLTQNNRKTLGTAEWTEAEGVHL